MVRCLLSLLVLVSLVSVSSADLVISNTMPGTTTTGRNVLTNGSVSNTGFGFTAGGSSSDHWRLDSLTLALLASSGATASNAAVDVFLYTKSGSALSFVSAASAGLNTTTITGRQTLTLSSFGNPQSMQLTGGQEYFLGLNFTATGLTGVQNVKWLTGGTSSTPSTPSWTYGNDFGISNAPWNTGTSSVSTLTGTPIEFNLNATAVPEPGTIIVFSLGTLAFAGSRLVRRARQKKEVEPTTV